MNPTATRGTPEVAALLEEVAGQKAQASGVKRQGVMQAVFCGEVGDRITSWVSDLGVKPAAVVVHVGIESGQYGVVAPQESGILGRNIEHGSVQIMEQFHRIVGLELGAIPGQQVKQSPGFRVPAPPQVAGQLAQATYPLRQVRKFAFIIIHQNLSSSWQMELNLFKDDFEPGKGKHSQLGGHSLDWGRIVPQKLADRNKVILFDNRGLRSQRSARAPYH